MSKKGKDRRERYQERQFNQVTALLDAAKISYQEILQKAHAVSSKDEMQTLVNKLSAQG